MDRDSLWCQAGVTNIDFPSNAALLFLPVNHFTFTRGLRADEGIFFFLYAEVQKQRVAFTTLCVQNFFCFFFLRLQTHKNQVVTVSEAEGEAGVKGLQFLGSFLSISSDSSQDAPGHQGTVSVCLYSNPSKVDQSPFFSTSSSSSFILFFLFRTLHPERVKDGQCRPSEAHSVFVNEPL